MINGSCNSRGPVCWKSHRFARVYTAYKPSYKSRRLETFCIRRLSLKLIQYEKFRPKRSNFKHVQYYSQADLIFYVLLPYITYVMESGRFSQYPAILSQMAKERDKKYSVKSP